MILGTWSCRDLHLLMTNHQVGNPHRHAEHEQRLAPRVVHVARRHKKIRMTSGGGPCSMTAALLRFRRSTTYNQIEKFAIASDPVKQMVLEPEQWCWNNFRRCGSGEAGFESPFDDCSLMP